LWGDAGCAYADVVVTGDAGVDSLAAENEKERSVGAMSALEVFVGCNIGL
jgi:hypothetical protein